MSYVALYRKFRPPVFEDVKGQDHIVTTLRNQIMSDRIGHAYLFCGTRGTGKTSVAKILARAVNCEHPVNGSPCGECDTCKAIAAGSNMNVIEMDAASNNGVDNVREIIEDISYSPTLGRYKIYIIDEAHMLTPAAFNALLKTIEEPPSYAIFIFATTDVQKIPITILSRCQRYDFHRITIDTIEDRLKEVTAAENIQAEEKALRYVARMADGSMRDSLSLLDQCIAFNYGQELTYERVLNVLGAVDTEIFQKLFQCLVNQDSGGATRLLAEMVARGGELTQYVNDFIWYLRNMMLIKSSDDVEDVMDISADNLALLKEQAEEASMDTIVHYIRELSKLSAQLRNETQKRILIEMTMIRLCHPEMESTEESLKERVAILERQNEKMRLILEGIQSGTIATKGVSAEKIPTAEDKEKRVALAKAVPEDVRQVVAEWDVIVRNMEVPLQTYLSTRPLPELALAENDTLIIVLHAKSFAPLIMEMEEDIKKAVNEHVGKEVPLELRYADPEKKEQETLINLSDIKMEILEEEEDDE